MTKYRAQKTSVDGIRFDSKGEALRYQNLVLLQRAGEISNLELQPTYAIEFNGVKICKVKLDFRYTDNQTGREVVEDFKGYDNAMSKLKRKLVKAFYGVEVVLS